MMTPTPQQPELTELLDLVAAATLLHDAEMFHAERHINLLIEVLLCGIDGSGMATA